MDPFTKAIGKMITVMVQAATSIMMVTFMTVSVSLTKSMAVERKFTQMEIYTSENTLMVNATVREPMSGKVAKPTQVTGPEIICTAMAPILGLAEGNMMDNFHMINLKAKEL